MTFQIITDPRFLFVAVLVGLITGLILQPIQMIFMLNLTKERRPRFLKRWLSSVIFISGTVMSIIIGAEIFTYAILFGGSGPHYGISVLGAVKYSNVIIFAIASTFGCALSILYLKISMKDKFGWDIGVTQAVFCASLAIIIGLLGWYAQMLQAK